MSGFDDVALTAQQDADEAVRRGNQVGTEASAVALAARAQTTAILEVARQLERLADLKEGI